MIGHPTIHRLDEVGTIEVAVHHQLDILSVMERGRPVEAAGRLFPPGRLFWSCAVALRSFTALEPSDQDAVPGSCAPTGRAQITACSGTQIAFPDLKTPMERFGIAGLAFNDLYEHDDLLPSIPLST